MTAPESQRAQLRNTLLQQDWAGRIMPPAAEARAACITALSTSSSHLSFPSLPFSTLASAYALSLGPSRVISSVTPCSCAAAYWPHILNKIQRLNLAHSPLQHVPPPISLTSSLSSLPYSALSNHQTQCISGTSQFLLLSA